MSRQFQANGLEKSRYSSIVTPLRITPFTDSTFSLSLNIPQVVSLDICWGRYRYMDRVQWFSGPWSMCDFDVASNLDRKSINSSFSVGWNGWPQSLTSLRKNCEENVLPAILGLWKVPQNPGTVWHLRRMGSESCNNGSCQFSSPTKKPKSVGNFEV